MPRSVGDLLEATKPTVSYSANTATTPNAPSTGRYVNSVSDLYGADEIEVLLDEIKDLEPCSVRTEDIQVTRLSAKPPELRAFSARHRVMTLDFEIAGSRTAVDEDGPGGDKEPHEGSDADSEGEAGARSLVGTVHSWDSHANYRHDLDDDDEGRMLFRGVIVYCDQRHLKSATGVVRVLLIVCTVACLIGLCASMSLRAPFHMLPILARLRLMLFVTIFTLLTTSVLLFLDISHTVYLFPFNWPLINSCLFISLGVAYLLGSSLLLHLVYAYNNSEWEPRVSGAELIVSYVFGFLCCVECVVLAVVAHWGRNPYRRVITADEINLQPSPLSSPTHTTAPSRPTSLVPPGSSAASSKAAKAKQHWPIDDHQQPCSSKQLDNYDAAFANA
ncbi:Hypothetical predicted protein [Cloeon dipterum]|uniref:MARVEL domain-containing protein n=1 Tax=Cloeon dipterum TaxID=197152 RepID=A0A8S1C1J3_9INSE|nr:Hypothetical predicted protein [Cloeon dipterum]